jgi:hypothetical protein
MFTEFTNQVFTPEDSSVVVSNETDSSVDGSSRKIVWTSALNKTCTISFTSIDLSTWEEISLYLYIKPLLTSANIFRITVNGVDYDFSQAEFTQNRWCHLLFDCSGMNAITTITITSLVDNLTLYIDYLGYRKVTYNMDIDIVTALKAHINLDYNVSTTLSANVAAGADSITLTNGVYVTDTSIIELDNGAGVIEEVELLNREGGLVNPTVHAFSSGNEARVICPIRAEDFDSLQPDPVCGVKIYDVSVDKQDTVEHTKNGSKIKTYLGSLGIIIYIDCSNKKKLLQMAREFQFKYGKEFQFLLDGEQVDIYMESSVFADNMIGNNPRMAYYYRLEPQPYLYLNRGNIELLNLSISSGIMQ